MGMGLLYSMRTETHSIEMSLHSESTQYRNTAVQYGNGGPQYQNAVDQETNTMLDFPAAFESLAEAVVRQPLVSLYPLVLEEQLD